VLCVATINPDSTAETYVRQHFRRIAPGETVVLYVEGAGRSVEHLPSLRLPKRRRTRGIMSQLQSLGNLVFHGYSGAIVGQAAHKGARFIEEHSVTAVLAEFGPTGCALLPLHRKLHFRLVVNFHGYDATVMPRRWQIRTAYRRLNKEADAFVCGSDHFRAVLENLGFDRSKIHVVPSGIEVENFRPAPEKDPNLVLAVGRFVEKKAPQLTIAAFARVAEQLPAARLEMIGDGPLLEPCRRIAAGQGLEDKIIFHGARGHDFVRERMAYANLFVQHSIVAANGDTESQGISLLEAMASEVPVVATRHNGFTETVVEGETGFLVEERDTGAMAVRMGSILNDPTLRAAMGQAGRERVLRLYAAELQAAKLRAILFPVDRNEAGSRS
jgi:glycosyltransferase involved in cell wall biosynthesis